MLSHHFDEKKKGKLCYLTTAKSRALLPAFLSMMVRSTKYDECTEAPQSFAKAFRRNPKETITWYEAEIDQVNLLVRSQTV